MENTHVKFNSNTKRSILVCKNVSHIKLPTFNCHLLCSLDNDKKGTDIYQVQPWPEKSSHSTNYVLLLQKADCCVDSYTWLLWENQFLLPFNPAHSAKPRQRFEREFRLSVSSMQFSYFYLSMPAMGGNNIIKRLTMALLGLWNTD